MKEKITILLALLMSFLVLDSCTTKMAKDDTTPPEISWVATNVTQGNARSEGKGDLTIQANYGDSLSIQVSVVDSGGMKKAETSYEATFVCNKTVEGPEGPMINTVEESSSAPLSKEKLLKSPVLMTEAFSLHFDCGEGNPSGKGTYKLIAKGTNYAGLDATSTLTIEVMAFTDSLPGF